MRDMSFKTRAPDESGLKDLWRTPKHIFDAANARFSFNVDLAASAGNSLVPGQFGFIDENQDALRTLWTARGSQTRGWLNPPYSRTADFTARCVDQSRKGAIVATLVPATVDVQWWHRDVIGIASECWLYTGRLAFIHPETGEPVSGNKGGSQLVIYTPGGPGWAGTRFGTLSHKTGLPVRPEDVAYWNANVLGA